MTLQETDRALDLPSGVEGVGEGIAAPNAAWTFSGATAEVFPEHARRSIPGYEAGHGLIAAMSDFFVRADSVVYELGTSRGELIDLLARRHCRHARARWIGLDSEPDMVALAKSRTSDLENVTIEVADVANYQFAPSDMILSYYCLQFVPPKVRQDVVNQIYAALHWGGAFVWFEKVRGRDARFQDILTLLYHDFKLRKGYTASEILAKSASLKGVLEPFSSDGNADILRRAGFVDFMPVFRHLCFEGILAIK
jgi:tRNA (cmo5U34)-methyltransferase